MTEFGFLSETFLTLIEGVPVTLTLVTSSVAIGGVLALALTLVRRASTIGNWLVSAYVFVLRGSPLLVQIFLIYYGLGQLGFVRQSFLWPFLREPYWCAITALALNTAAYQAEVLRGGLNAVPNGAIEAARVCGMTRFTMLRRIILPIAIRQALPAYTSEVVIMVKATSLASIITLFEVTGLAYSLVSETFRAFEVLSVAGAIYLAMNYALTTAFAVLERRLTPQSLPVPQRPISVA
ncbi:ABC transporter permease [Siculibacillus lacustris]|uniref:ABC transporter permease n=1 Tax=Siculibacillus lacustris TaxID=1549641 RepID=A0A4Q9VQD7_9HYPH|nr:ABC transporter permease [Siculibacillus lacustris]TBW38037.1 ABC transporter permease [Siculibacillus lacustris]